MKQSHHGGFVLKVSYVVAMSVLPLCNLFLLKVMVDVVSQGGAGLFDKALPCALGFCGVYLAQRILAALNGMNNDLLSQRLQDHISERLQWQASRLDMAYFDNPRYHDTFHRAQQEATHRPIRLIENLVSAFGSLVSLVGVLVVMIASVSWWIVVVMMLLAVPSFLVRTKKVRSIYRFRRDNTQTYRRTSYFHAVLTNKTFSKEVRAYGLNGYFRDRFVAIRKVLVKELLRISRKLGLYESIGAVIEIGALCLVIVGLLHQAACGLMSVGAFVMVFEAVRRGQGYLQSLVENVSGIYENRLFVANIFEFLELQPQVVSAQHPQPFPTKVHTIEWRDITFRYPDMKKNVVEHFSLMARLGDVARINGENGFGKTTLMKLLLRLYDPDEGVVLVNGIDIRQFDIKELRRNVGVMFQDYVQFSCTLRENIVLGDVASGCDEQRMVEAARMAGADKIASQLPEGYDTQLGRMFDGGEELSMGQWQRIALARLFYGNAPVMVFDEPMAWLDESAREHFEQVIEKIKNEHLIIIIRHI